MGTERARILSLAGLAVIALAGCMPSAGDAAKLPANFPLFTNTDGYASLTVTVVDNRRLTQDYADVDDSDRVRFTLSSATNLASSRVATASLILGSSQTFNNVFTGVRPGNDYQLKAELYKQIDLTSESSFTQANVRGEGLSNTLTLAAGSATAATLKINSVGTISFSGSANQSVVSDFKVVEGDVLTIDTGMTSTNNPGVKRIEVSYKQGTTGTQRTLLTTTTITGSSTTFSWTVPTIPTSQEAGTLYVTGYDATSGGNQLTQKTKTVTVYKGASVTPVTLN